MQVISSQIKYVVAYIFAAFITNFVSHADGNTYCANVAVGCDNRATIYRHDTNGITDITSKLFSGVMGVEDISSTTKLEFVCDSTGGYGAFIATVNFGGTLYSTKNPIASTNFNVIQGSSGSYCYGSKTWHPWWGTSNQYVYPYIASDANTIWFSCGYAPQGMGWNVPGTMKFEFDFASIPFNTPSPTFACVTQSPTKYPSRMPSQMPTVTTIMLTGVNSKTPGPNPIGWNRPAQWLDFDKLGLTGGYYRDLDITTDFTQYGSVTITGVKCDYSLNPFRIFYSDDMTEWQEYGDAISVVDAQTIYKVDPPINTKYARLRWETTSGSDNFHAQFVGYMNPSMSPTKSPTKTQSQSPSKPPSQFPTVSPTFDECDLDINSYLDKYYCLETNAHSNSAQIVSEESDINIDNQYIVLSKKIDEIQQDNSDMKQMMKIIMMLLILFCIVSTVIVVIICVVNKNNFKKGNNYGNKTYGKVDVNLDCVKNDDIENDFTKSELTSNRL
eukprot:537833_1